MGQRAEGPGGSPAPALAGQQDGPHTPFPSSPAPPPRSRGRGWPQSGVQDVQDRCSRGSWGTGQGEPSGRGDCDLPWGPHAPSTARAATGSHTRPSGADLVVLPTPPPSVPERPPVFQTPGTAPCSPQPSPLIPPARSGRPGSGAGVQVPGGARASQGCLWGASRPSVLPGRGGAPRQGRSVWVCDRFPVPARLCWAWGTLRASKA